MGNESVPTTLVVEMMKGCAEASARDAEEIVLAEGESFELGALTNDRISRTYGRFDEEFSDVAEHIPRTLAAITPRGRLIHVFVDLGPHRQGEFDAWLDGVQLVADRPSMGSAVPIIDRRENNGFVLELQSKRLQRSLRITATFGVRGRVTLTRVDEAVELLREYIVPETTKASDFAIALAVALREHEDGRRDARPRADILDRIKAQADSRFAMSGDKLAAATRYAYRKVFVWIVDVPPRVRRRPDHGRWVDALAAAGLDRLALPKGTPSGPSWGVEFRERNTVEALLDLAAGLSDAGALTFADVSHLVAPRS